MVANHKSLFLLKINEAENSDEYKIIAGLEAVRFNLSGEVVNATNIASGRWQKLLSGAGVKSVSILADGIFKNTEYEGSYVFRFNASGTSLGGNPFTRTKATGEYVRVEVDPASSDTGRYQCHKLSNGPLRHTYSKYDMYHRLVNIHIFDKNHYDTTSFFRLRLSHTHISTHT